MSRVAFHLKRPNEQTPQRVFALYHVDGKQVKFYTGLSVTPKDWIKNKQRVKPSAVNAAPINDKLSEIVRQIEQIAFQLSNEGSLTPQRLKYEFQQRTNTGPTAKRSLLNHVDEWIKAADSDKRSLTIRNYGTCKNHLFAFCKARDFEPTLSAVDKKFVEEFTDYLTNVVGLVNTSRWSILKNLKTFLRWAYDNNQTTNRIFDKIKKKNYHVVEPPIIRLLEGELQAIAKLDLSNEPALANARDLFLMQCSLGVRYSDLVKITAANVEGDVVRITTEKTRKEIAIPLYPTVREIIMRDKPPYPLSNQKLNKHLKEIAKRAGLTAQVTISSFQGTKRSENVYNKHELVTTHTAKRTFVSLMIGRRVGVDTIMAITGNNRSTIDRYISLDQSEIQADLLKINDPLR